MLHKVRSILLILNILHTLWQAYQLLLKSKRRRRNRSVKLRRDELKIFETCVNGLKLKDDENFLNTVQMEVSNFEGLLLLLQKRLSRGSNRKPISPEMRLAVTIMYLAHGCSFQLLAWTFKLGLSTVRCVVYDTCQAIWDELQPIYMASPDITNWEQTSDRFLDKTGMPHCLGAIDGKLINIICPRGSESLFYNYKKSFSILLLAACDADYKFTLVDVGAVGCQNDNDVFTRSVFGNRILTNTLPVPEQKKLPNTSIFFPHYFVGGSTFPLRNNLIRPFPGKNLSPDKINFNKILSKARVRIEIAFGILANRWRILRTTINAAPKNVDKIVLATVVLHNFLMLQKDKRYFSASDVKELQASNEKPLPSAKLSYSNRSSQMAFELRNTLKDYLNTE